MPNPQAPEPAIKCLALYDETVERRCPVAAVSPRKRRVRAQDECTEQPRPVLGCEWIQKDPSDRLVVALQPEAVQVAAVRAQMGTWGPLQGRQVHGPTPQSEGAGAVEREWHGDRRDLRHDLVVLVDDADDDRKPVGSLHAGEVDAKINRGSRHVSADFIEIYEHGSSLPTEGAPFDRGPSSTAFPACCGLRVCADF